MRATPDYQVVRKRSGSLLLRYLVVLLIGALSMLIPIDSSCTLRGQLPAATAPAPAPTQAAERVELTPPHPIIQAQPAQCALLGYDQPAVVAVDAPRLGSVLFEAQIVRIAPHAERLSEHGGTPVCQIELALLPIPDEPECLRELPPGAALSVTFATQPRTWLALLVDQLAGDVRCAAPTLIVDHVGQLGGRHS